MSSGSFRKNFLSKTCSLKNNKVVLNVSIATRATIVVPRKQTAVKISATKKQLDEYLATNVNYQQVNQRIGTTKYFRETDYVRS